MIFTLKSRKQHMVIPNFKACLGLYILRQSTIFSLMRSHFEQYYTNGSFFFFFGGVCGIAGFPNARFETLLLRVEVLLFASFLERDLLDRLFSTLPV